MLCFIEKRRKREYNHSSCFRAFTSMMSESMDPSRDSKLSHVKKPLNAFMLYMKDMRPKVVAECTLKESAAINQILGKKVSCAYFGSIFCVFHIQGDL
jgi:hypothetical protein